MSEKRISIHFITRNLWIDLEKVDDLFKQKDIPYHNEFELFYDDQYLGNILNPDMSNIIVLMENLIVLAGGKLSRNE